MDCRYMKRAIELALKGTGRVQPNPLVGAVIVKNGDIIGEGYHARYGELHAERAALESCVQSAEGADLYVTLEPCCHNGKQPPCTDAIIESGIKRVFVGSYDPNPLVSGKSRKILEKAEIEVQYEVMKEECDRLNPFFFHYMKNKLPYVICKYAMSADGKIACKNGSSKWVTGEMARERVQEIRRQVSAVMVGIGTVLADDPSLLCRCKNDPVNPVRVICDTRLRIPLYSQLIRSAKESPVIIMTSSEDEEKTALLKAMGAEVIVLPMKNGHTDMREIISILAEKGLTSVLVEGGAEIHASVLKEKLACELQVFIASKIVGGDGLSPVGDMELADMMKALPLRYSKTELLGSDVLITYNINV